MRDVPTSSFNLDVDPWFGEACRPTVQSVVDHMRKILTADLDRPILLSAEGHVLDGLHRLAKCSYQGVPVIKAQQSWTNPPPYDVVDFDDFRLAKPVIADTLVWMEKHTL